MAFLNKTVRDAVVLLWNEGLSASTISYRLGISRSSVLGHAFRAKLPKRNVDTRTPRPRPPEKPRAPVLQKPVVPDNSPPSLNVALEDMRMGLCYWPYGDNPFTFCGNSSEPNKQYCSYHRSISYVPTKTRAA